jgi:probable HAF family extracellular repeat protein
MSAPVQEIDMRVLRVSFAVLLVIVAVSSLSAGQQYTVTDLGTLFNALSSYSQGMNDKGQVVGWNVFSGGHTRAFLWSSDTGMIDLHRLHTYDLGSVAYGINDIGAVVGSSGSYAFLWTSSAGMKDLGNLGSLYSAAYGINDMGQIVGLSTLTNGAHHAFLWNRNTGMQDLGSLGGDSAAVAINSSGQVVGWSNLADNITQHAFLWTPQTGLQDLGTLGGTRSVATAINASGEVVGFFVTSNGEQRVFTWDLIHGMRPLGNDSKVLPVAYGINQHGQIVGTFSEFPQTGFRWVGGNKFQDLNDLISHENGEVVQAVSINRPGQIAGGGSNGHAILLTPTKQPSSQRSKP